ncbi:MAG TPA: aspartyl protease family protein [Candidatus Angelobacter sp.]|nr:aspartyl protease family protein [Candidatus Angelobacter sp.]
MITSLVVVMYIGLSRFGLQQDPVSGSAGPIVPTVSSSVPMQDPSSAQGDQISSDAACVPRAHEAVDFRIRPVSVHFCLVANFILLPVKLNDTPQPFFLMLDTGAQNFLSPEIVGQLGLKVTGSYLSRGAGNRLVNTALTSVETLRIGDLTLQNQPFYVVPLPFALRHGLHPEIVGGIGYQLLRSMAVYIDYAQRTLTFYPPEIKPPRRSAGQIVVPFFFHERVPVIQGHVDGIPAQFQIDTGSDTTLTLFAPFVAHHDLVHFYSPRLHGFAGEGVGGRETAFFVRTHKLEIGDQVAMHGITAELLEDKGGIGDEQETSGNIGSAILKQFNLLFDYPRHKLYIEKNSHFGQSEVFNRTGLGLRITPLGLKVMSVFEDSPAGEAGIIPGDIIMAINGHRGADLDGAFLARVLRARPGTAMHLDLLRQGIEENVTIRLRKLLN